MPSNEKDLEPRSLHGLTAEEETEMLECVTKLHLEVTRDYTKSESEKIIHDVFEKLDHICKEHNVPLILSQNRGKGRKQTGIWSQARWNSEYLMDMDDGLPFHSTYVMSSCLNLNYRARTEE
jgi:hypothetical protein